MFILVECVGDVGILRHLLTPLIQRRLRMAVSFGVLNLGRCNCTMSEVTDFELKLIVGERMVSASVSKVAEVYRVSKRYCIENLLRTFEIQESSSAKSQRGR